MSDLCVVETIEVDGIDKVRLAMDAEYRASSYYEALGATNEAVRRLAVIVHAMYVAGDEIPLSRGAVCCLLRIAEGQALPDFWIPLARKPGVCAKIAELPIEEQREIAKSKTVAVIVPSERPGDKLYTDRRIDVSALTPQQVNQVFHHERRLRTEAEQIAHLESMRVYGGGIKVMPAPKTGITVDKAKREIVVHEPARISHSQLMSYIAELG